MPVTAVIGAGISGLAAALELIDADPRARVLLLEASDRVGGKLLRRRVAGYWIDVGAESVLARRPEALAAFDRAGLGDQVIHPLSTSAGLCRGDQIVALPTGTLMGIPTDPTTVGSVLSEAAVRHLAEEPQRLPLQPLRSDLAIGVLVDDRFGAEVTDRLVEPLLGGVYAGQARQISLQAALPGLYDRLAGSGGSLLRATAQVLGSSAVTPSGGMAAEPAPVFASVSGGLGRFVERLAELLTDSGRVELRMRCTVRSVDRLSHGFRLTTGPVSSPEFLEVDSVVLAAPASKSAAMLRRVAPAASADLAGIPSASIAIVTLAFEGSAVQGRLRGSGLLIPPVDGFTVKAMTFSSNKWPGVGGPDVLLRASLGRYGEQHALQREDSELVTLVRGELATLTGLRVEPLDVDVQRWGGGLPQYEVGHGDRVRRIRAAVAEHPGLAICGAALDGVGIPACIASARVAVDRLVGSPLGTDLSATDRSASGGLGSGGLASGGLGSDRLASDRLPHSPSGGGH